MAPKAGVPAGSGVTNPILSYPCSPPGRSSPGRGVTGAHPRARLTPPDPPTFSGWGTQAGLANKRTRGGHAAAARLALRSAPHGDHPFVLRSPLTVFAHMCDACRRGVGVVFSDPAGGCHPLAPAGAPRPRPRPRLGPGAGHFSVVGALVRPCPHFHLGSACARLPPVGSARPCDLAHRGIASV